MPIYYIGGSQTLPPPLSQEEEETVLNSLSKGDELAKKTLVERNLRLVVYIAKKFENTGGGARGFNLNRNYRINESNKYI